MRRDRQNEEAMVTYEKLMKDLEATSGMSRAHAAYELGKLGDRTAARDLIRILDDPHMGVRSNAAYSLGELGATQEYPTLCGS